MDIRAHWDAVYQTKDSAELSWFQEHAELSLEFIRMTGAGPAASILDVGGGDSRLVDDLVARGYRRVSVLDISSAALARARARLGARSELVRWAEQNVIDATIDPASIDVWHDRAVFHFLTSAEHRTAYIQQVRRAVRPGGHVIVATFAEDGPARCSGLPVERYSADALHDTFGAAFTLVRSSRQAHHTPSGAEQRFTYCWCIYAPVIASAA